LVKVRIRAVFSGRVQGVFFRANAKHFADEEGVTGWVSNREDGSVEALFEGEERNVLSVIDKCRDEQPYARVSSVETAREEYRGDLAGFIIVH